MKTLACILFSVITLNTQAQTYLIEQFNYGATADTLCGTTGVTTNWVPHITGTFPVKYQTLNLTYSGYSTVTAGSGSMVFTNGTGTRECINTAVPAQSSGSVYLSFLMKVAAAGVSLSGTPSDYCIHFNDTFGTSLSSNSIGRLFLKSGGLVPGFKLGLSKSSAAATAVYTSTNYAVSTTFLVVMKYVFNTTSSADDSVYAWLFSSGVPAVEPTPLLAAIDTASDLSQIRSVCVRQGTGITYTVTIDEMRLGTDWGNTVLPVNMLDVSAILKNENAVLLKWSTASEINNDHFEIERSADNNQWMVSAKIKGNGNSTAMNTYQFTDDISMSGMTNVLYYRIKQVDYDGKFTYSKIISVELNNRKNVISVSPNPFTDEITLTSMFSTSKTIHVEIFDLVGKRFYNENMELNASDTSASLNLAMLPPKSIYMLKVNDKIYKLIKE